VGRRLTQIHRRLFSTNSALKHLTLLIVALIAAWGMTFFFVGYQFYTHDFGGVVGDLFRSFGGNLLFFVLVGLTALIASIYRPRDEPIDRRVEFLITSSDVSTSAVRYIREAVTRLCAYYEEFELELIILEVSSDQAAMRVERRSRSKLKNVFMDEAYTDRNFHIMAYPDPVDCSEGMYGGISLSEAIVEGSVRDLIETPVYIRSPNMFEQSVALTLPANGSAILRTHLWIWCYSHIPYFVFFHRYCENVRVLVRNETDQTLCLRSLDPEQSFDLRTGESRTIYEGAAVPGNVELFSLVESL